MTVRRVRLLRTALTPLKKNAKDEDRSDQLFSINILNRWSILGIFFSVGVLMRCDIF